MGPEGRTKCLCYNPELGHWAASNDLGQDQRGCPCQCSCVLHQDHVDGQILGQLSPLTEQDEEEGTGATSPAEPAFPGMGSEELRLASFYNWPLATGVQPELLAAAGFFHTGESWVGEVLPTEGQLLFQPLPAPGPCPSPCRGSGQ